jgi:hypothetical protein
MHGIETIYVTSDERVKKTFSTGWGGGVCRIFGEDTAKMEQETANRIARIGDCRVVI